MKIDPLHDWDLTPKQATALQRQLSERVERDDCIDTVGRVAGIDVGFESDGQVTRAAVAVLSFPQLLLVEHAIARLPTRFPYVPGLLSFREAPAAVAALEGLSTLPDLVIYDGQGIAHPRRMGIACHIGLLTGIPTIGVAKTRLTGGYGKVPDRRGAWTPLTDKGEVVGAVLRTRIGVKPVFVSIGHRVSLATAVTWTMSCTTRYRLPETTRWAHRLASG
jgi:deoxyribonuclease V